MNVVEHLYLTESTTSFAAIESFSRACRRFKRLSRDWRTLRVIAYTHFPRATRIFVRFEASPQNLVLIASTSKRCDRLASSLRDIVVTRCTIKFDGARVALCFLIGLLTVEMIKKRKAYFRGTDYVFLKEIPWPHLIMTRLTVHFISRLISQWSPIGFSAIIEYVPALARVRRRQLPDVILLGVLRSGVQLLERLLTWVQSSTIDQGLFAQLNWDCTVVWAGSLRRNTLSPDIEPDVFFRPDQVLAGVIRNSHAELAERGMPLSDQQLVDWGAEYMLGVPLECMLAWHKF